MANGLTPEGGVPPPDKTGQKAQPPEQGSAQKPDTIGQWFEAVNPGGTQKGEVPPRAEGAPEQDTVKQWFEAVNPPPDIKEQPQMGEKLKQAVDHVFKPGLDHSEWYGDPDGTREAYLKQFAGKDTDLILQDNSLTEDQKYDKLKTLRGHVMTAAILAQRNQLVPPDKFIDEMQGYMRSAGKDKQTTKDLSVLYLKGYMGGALALSHIVRGVWAASEIGRIQNQTPDQTMGEYGELFNDLRQKFWENRDENGVRFLDSIIKDKFGFEWSMQADGGKVKWSYTAPK